MARHILVTGGAGYIGSHTCKALAAAGYIPVAYDNLVYGHRWAVRWGPLIVGDLLDAELLQRVLCDYQVGAIMHFAAYAYVGESMAEPGKYFTNNIVGSINLLQAALTAGVRHMVFSSTCATYGLPDQVPIDEDQPQRPINPYGESKLVTERALYWYGQAHGLAWAALRYFNAAGADPEGEIGEEHDPETHLVPSAIQAALGGRAYVEIYGADYSTADGTAIRDYIHVTDLAAAHVAALDYLLAGGSSVALNLGTGTGHSVREVIAMVERVSRCAVPARIGARRPGDPPALVANPSRGIRVLHWTPVYSSLSSIVETAWAWHAQRHCPASTAIG